jgi:hypothetical protein
MKIKVLICVSFMSADGGEINSACSLLGTGCEFVIDCSRTRFHRNYSKSTRGDGNRGDNPLLPSHISTLFFILNTLHDKAISAAAEGFYCAARPHAE